MIIKSELINTINLLQNRDHRKHSSRTWLANVHGGSGKVALKDLPRDRFISEIFASLVANAIEFSTPTVHMVKVSSEKAEELKIDHGLRSADGSILLFGSEYISASSLVKGKYTECLELFNSEAFSRIIVFDILVGNNDRAYRNLLKNETTLIPIDHDQVFHGLNWTAETLVRSAGKPNHSTLDTDLIYANDTTRNQMRDIARNWSDLLCNSQQNLPNIISDLPSELAITNEELSAITQYITVRSKKLVCLLNHKLTIHKN